MHKKTLIFGIILGLSSALAGIYIWNTFASKPASNQQQATQQTTEKTVTEFIQPAPEGDLNSGDGLTPVEMFTELQKVSDPEEFNRKYMTYMILLKNTEGGMAKLVESKSNRSELKNQAIQSSEADRPYVQNMLQWQRLWGYTDH